MERNVGYSTHVQRTARKLKKGCIPATLQSIHLEFLQGCNPATYQDPSKTVARNGMEGGLWKGTSVTQPTFNKPQGKLKI